MKTVKIYVYGFDELDPKVQAKVLNDMSDINIEYDWWTDTYEDADMVGLRIVSFDVNDGSITVVPNIPVSEIIEKILASHGGCCNTAKTATKNSGPLDLEDDFMEEIAKDYLDNLREDYEYRTSTVGIVESINANEFEFLKDGTLFNSKKYSSK